MAEADEEEEEELPEGAEPLSPEEQAAATAAKACEGDWGPVFVYGSMLFPTAWSDLVDRLPEMSSATLRGYERRCFTTGGFAGIFEQPGASVIGMLVTGLMPKERLLLDAVVDDSFVLVDAVVEPTGDAEARLRVSDCGLPEFNGRYVPDGVKDGRTCYRRQEQSRSTLYKTIHFEDGQWHCGEDYKGFFYKADWDGKFPPADGWVIDSEGITPVPHVSKEAVRIECSMYAVRESCMDALGDSDWDFEAFGEECLEGFAALCRDTQVARRDEKLAYEDLKELALARRRRQTGYEEEHDEEEDRPDRDGQEDDPDAVDPRLGVEFPGGIIRLQGAVAQGHVREASWVKVVLEALQDGSGRTPAEEKAHLEENEQAELGKRRKQLGVKYPPEPTSREAGTLLEQLRDGTRRLYGEDREPLVVSGLPATRGTDFCVVSLPLQRYDWYARAVIACATFRVGLAAVSEPHFEEVWLWVWKRNVEKMVKENKLLVVLTQVEQYGGAEDKAGMGRVDFSQSVQVLYLQEKGYDFVAVDVLHFCTDLQPVVTAASKDSFDTVEQCLMSRRSIPVPLARVVDGTGRTALHYAARLGPSQRVMRMLIEAGENINAAQWCCDEHEPGWTPLHHAAKYGPPRMVRLLFESHADAHARTAAGKTVFDLARGRADNERMVSQCHWRCCLACNSGEETPKPKPLPLPPAPEEGGATSAEAHAANCQICSRFL